MPPDNDPSAFSEWSPVNLAFSKQAVHFDQEDRSNPILQEWRKQIYDHVERFLKPGDRLLELNAGTGIDALHFAKQGYSVLATDLSSGMITEIEKKISLNPILHLLCRQISYENLDQLGAIYFDYAFSNFGGLNCIRDLTLVTRHLANMLKPQSRITWVIMPPFSPWEFLWLFKGKWREAFRRFRGSGTLAQLEGEHFKTYYHSLSAIRNALGNKYELIKAESLGVFSAPPSAVSFHKNHPRLYRLLRKADSWFKDHYPFNRWGDHIIVTFRKAD